LRPHLGHTGFVSSLSIEIHIHRYTHYNITFTFFFSLNPSDNILNVVSGVPDYKPYYRNRFGIPRTSRMLSISQRKAILVATKSDYTVDGNALTVGHQWSNEKLTSFPRILLNIPEETILDQKSVGNIVDSVGTKGQRSLIQLSINILAKQPNDWDLNYITLAKDIAKQLISDIQTNWHGLSSDTVKLYRMSSVRDLTAIEAAQGNLDTSRIQFDCYLHYTNTW